MTPVHLLMAASSPQGSRATPSQDRGQPQTTFKSMHDMLPRRCKRNRGLFEDGMQEDSFIVGGGGIKGPVTWSECGVSMHASSMTTGGLLKRWGAAGQLSKLASTHLQQDPGGHQSSVAKDRRPTGRPCLSSETPGGPAPLRGSRVAGLPQQQQQQSSRFPFLLCQTKLLSRWIDTKQVRPLSSLFRACLFNRCRRGEEKKHASMLNVVTRVHGDRLTRLPARSRTTATLSICSAERQGCIRQKRAG